MIALCWVYAMIYTPMYKSLVYVNLYLVCFQALIRPTANVLMLALHSDHVKKTSNDDTSYVAVVIGKWYRDTL